MQSHIGSRQVGRRQQTFLIWHVSTVCYWNDFSGACFFLFILLGKVCGGLILQATTIRWKRSSAGEVIGIIYMLPMKNSLISYSFPLPEVDSMG